MVVVGTLVLLTVSAGCLGGTALEGSPSTSDVSPTNDVSSTGDVLAFPEKPTKLTDESVVEYARQYERAVTYRAVKEPNNRVSLTCNATVEAQTENGFYVRAGCAVTTHSNGGVGSGGPGIGRAYFINNATTVPIPIAKRFDRARDAIYRSQKDTENVAGAPDLRILNFDTERHEVTVTLTYLGTTPPESAFESRYEVPAESGLEQGGVTLRKGTYRLRVRLENGTTATYRWNVTEDTMVISVYIMRNGEIAIHTPSILRLPET